MKNIQTSIISTENIQYALYNLDRLEKLKEMLVEIGFAKIYIIVYSRDLQDLYISMYSQAIKDGAKMTFYNHQIKMYNTELYAIISKL